MSQQCIVLGCNQNLSREGHRFCYRHWKMEKAGQVREDSGTGTWREVVHNVNSESIQPSDMERLSSTKLGKHFGLSATRVNLILAELGWIEKYTKGWLPTERGKQQGAEVREARQSGVPYVVWPQSICGNKVLLASIADSVGDQSTADNESPPLKENAEVSKSSDASDFRERFPAKFRATDGHMVRSRAEMLIDNWLYMQGIVHAFERKLPIEEEVYCDFYLPAGKVYIEYWGMENDPKYAARKAEKIEIYQRYNLNLVQLNDDDIMNLDDIMPRQLLKFNIDCT